jgi:DNA topoisomerase-1
MSKSLVIVESPKKAKTISKILGKDYQVKASVGHVRDLPSRKLGVNVRKNFEIQYEILPDKEDIVAELREAANLADKVYLAPDPDREGEAIAWHLSELLDLPKKKLMRVTFNEITKDAVTAAIKKPRPIDQSLVDAQQARRVLDRLVGYKISPLLWRKVNGRSAGRVQSVAVRLICERELEIEAFGPQEYWSIKAELTRAHSKNPFVASLYKYSGKRVLAASDKQTSSSMVVSSEKEALKIVDSFKKETFTVSSITSKESQRQPQAPYITSTLQRDVAGQLGYSVKKAMQIAQSLYEGVELGNQGPVGLITYMRTDSTRISPQAQEETLEFIETKYGKDYRPSEPRIYARKVKGAQDAHEAIRPTDVNQTPEILRPLLTSEQYKLYKLIWERYVASQMASAELVTRTAEITAGEAVFRASATDVKFAGYTLVYNRGLKLNDDSSGEEANEDAGSLPEGLTKADKLKLKEAQKDQHFTQPPPRYNEASMVKALEDLGIGRPSTYASTVNTIVERKYVEKQGKALVPTKLGKAVTLLLVEHFGSFINVDFTAAMELKLDQIEEDKVDWHSMMKEFYVPFGATLKLAEENMNKVIILSDKSCPTCGDQMAIRSSRYGQFLGCIKYPECKTTIKLTPDGEPVPEDRASEEICRTCGSSMLIRYGRYGDYLVCSSEACTEQRPILKLTGVDCPREGCGGQIVEKKSRRGKIFFGCSNYSQNQCDSAFWYPPLISGGPKKGTNRCPKCDKILVYKTLKRGDQVACSSKECDFAELVTGKEVSAQRVAPPVASVAAAT